MKYNSSKKMCPFQNEFEKSVCLGSQHYIVELNALLDI